jgi:phosphatidylinositol 4-phosphatase
MWETVCVTFTPQNIFIYSRRFCAAVLDITHAVYGVKGVTAIPLTYERATVVLNTLAAKHAAQPRPSLIPGLSTNTIDTIGSTDVDADDDDPLPHASLSATKDDSVQLVEPPPEGPAAPLEIQTSPRVKFAEEHDIKVLTPLATRTQFEREAAYDNSPPSPSSDVSTPASDISVGTGTGNTVESLAKTLANRLSFWGQASKRTSVQSDATSEQQSIAKEGQKELPELSDVRASVDGRDEQQQAIQSIVQNAAQVPPTQAAQHSELENKVVREIIREYTKGGMYFAYNFGTFPSHHRKSRPYILNMRCCIDITRSLQHKHEAIEKARGKSGPPRDLGTKSPDGDNTGGLDTVDVLAEPDPTLPLWRRVDRQFWWNEWLSKPFVDAGVCVSPLIIAMIVLTNARFLSYTLMSSPLCRGTIKCPSSISLVSRKTQRKGMLPR